MPLTPQDVHDKVFTPTRFKPGYDENEVDAFLDEVEAELGRLLTENTSLAEKLKSAGPSAPPSLEKTEPVREADPDAVAHAVSAALATAAREAEAEKVAALARAESDKADALAAAAAGHETALAEAVEQAKAEVAAALPAPTAADAPGAAPLDLERDPRVVEMTETLQRTLVIAQRTADEVVAQAREEARLTTARAAEEAAQAHAEAERILTEARDQAAVLTASAQAEHAALVAGAQEQATQLTASAAAEHEAVVSAAREKAATLESEVQGRHEAAQTAMARLSSFEQEHRGRLEAFLRKQLADLSSLEPVPAAVPAAVTPPGDSPPDEHHD